MRSTIHGKYSTFKVTIKNQLFTVYSLNSKRDKKCQQLTRTHLGLKLQTDPSLEILANREPVNQTQKKS